MKQKAIFKIMAVIVFIIMLLTGFGFGQEEVPIEAKSLLDFTLKTPAEKCFQILLQFQDGWLENMTDMRDSIICPNMIDVRIEYEGKITDYTMDEFLERLGFKEEK